MLSCTANMRCSSSVTGSCQVSTLHFVIIRGLFFLIFRENEDKIANSWVGLTHTCRKMCRFRMSYFTPKTFFFILFWSTVILFFTFQLSEHFCNFPKETIRQSQPLHTVSDRHTYATFGVWPPSAEAKFTSKFSKVELRNLLTWFSNF